MEPLGNPIHEHTLYNIYVCIGEKKRKNKLANVTYGQVESNHNSKGQKVVQPEIPV